ncbi:MAG: thermonuclease family protein, partial [Mesorhizobium sp.]
MVTVVAAGALAAQTAMQHSDHMPELHLPNWTSAGLATIAGVASVIDGDTIE